MRGPAWPGLEGADLADSNEAAQGLVFAIAHEVGNHLGGIRLQAHLLDEDLDTRSLAEASITIDELAGRAGPLLSLLRPLLSDDWRASSGESWASLLGRVQRHLEDEGTRGVRIERKGVAEDSVEAPDFEWLHPLLVSLVGATLLHLGRGRGSLSLSLEVRDTEACLVVEDDGSEEDLSVDAAYRGRPLTVAIARELVGRAGGRVDSARVADRTRVELVFPIAG